MKTKLAVSKEKYFQKLIANKKQATEKFSLEIIELDEKSCYKALIENRVDAGLISPFGFAKCLEKGDYSLVSGPILAAEGYTEIATLFYKENAFDLKSCGTFDTDSFISKIAKIILTEKYGLDIQFFKDENNKTDILKKYDIALMFEKSSEKDISQDLSEEWFDSYEIPLILGLWVVRSEEYPENIKEIINYLIEDNLNNETEVVEKISKSTRVEKSKGKLIWKWNEEFRAVLEDIFEILYYYQFIYDIHDIVVI